MSLLKGQLENYLHEWRDDLSPNWRSFFLHVEPALESFPTQFQYDPAFPIIPGRQNHPNVGAPSGAHVFRAFDGLAPDDVKVIVVGQDPYPKVGRATGRAFEDGALSAWSGSVAISLQRLMQSAVALRLGRPELASSPGGWAVIQQEIEDDQLQWESPREYFDRRQMIDHVLFVNAGWTLTRFESGGGDEQKAHVALWKPLMTRLLRGLAERPSQSIVFLLLGAFARRLFVDSGVEAAARSSGAWGSRVRSVTHPHPNTAGETGYLARGNPLAAVNTALAEMGSQTVAW